MRRKSRLKSAFLAVPALLIAAGGAYFNYYLINRPVVAFFDGDGIFGAVGTISLILTGILLGLTLTESRGATRLLPFIAALGEKTRAWISRLALMLLQMLALLEAYLAYLHEIFVHIQSSASGVNTPITPIESVLTQIAMGYLLPLALGFIAFPLQMLVDALLGRPDDHGDRTPDALPTEE